MLPLVGVRGNRHCPLWGSGETGTAPCGGQGNQGLPLVGVRGQVLPLVGVGGQVLPLVGVRGQVLPPCRGQGTVPHMGGGV